jgi:hypothetical protein
VPVLVMLGVDVVSQGAAYIEVDGAGPQLSDDVGGLLQDLVKHGAIIDVPRSATSGDAAAAPGFLGTADLGVSELHLPGPPGFPPLPINWRRVEDEAESVYS